VAVVLGAGLTMAGCAEDGSDPSSGGPPGSGSPPATSGAAAGATPSSGAAVPAALQFSAPKVGGGRFDGATLAGKPAVLWFWAAWCPRCKAKADDVAALADEFTGRVQMVGVAGLGSGDGAMRQFVEEEGIGGFPNLADDEGSVWRRFEVTEQEYFVVIDASGTVVHKGPLGTDGLRDRMTALAG
jgi:peroxiredoxin